MLSIYFSAVAIVLSLHLSAAAWASPPIDLPNGYKEIAGYPEMGPTILGPDVIDKTTGKKTPGLIWGSPVKDPSEAFLSVSRYSGAAFCSSMGARLPSASEYRDLAAAMGYSTNPAKNHYQSHFRYHETDDMDDKTGSPVTGTGPEFWTANVTRYGSGIYFDVNSGAVIDNPPYYRISFDEPHRSVRCVIDSTMSRYRVTNTDQDKKIDANVSTTMEQPSTLGGSSATPAI